MIKNPIEFCITAHPGFPQRQSFLDMCEEIRHEFASILEKTDRPTSRFMNSCQKVMQSYQGKLGAWSQDMGRERYGLLRNKTNDYDSIFRTHLTYPRYIDYTEELLKKDIRFRADKGVVPVEITIGSETKIAGLILYIKNPDLEKVGANSVFLVEKNRASANNDYFFYKELLKSGFRSGMSAVFIHSPEKAGNLFTQGTFATSAEMNRQADDYISALLNRREIPLYDQGYNLGLIRNCFNQSTEFKGGGETFSSLAVLAIADKLDIDLPMMKLGKCMWFENSTSTEDGFATQFAFGVKLRAEYLKTGKIQNMDLLGKTCFDPFLSPQELKEKALYFKTNEGMKVPYEFIVMQTPAEICLRTGRFPNSH